MFTTYQWLTIIGVPSIISIIAWAIKQWMNIRKIMAAHQIQLRDTLMTKYKKYMKYGGITAEDMELWEAMYQSYHSLGKNGVMDARREQLIALPVVDDYV